MPINPVEMNVNDGDALFVSSVLHTVALAPVTYYPISIHGKDGERLVAINGDGTLEYGPNYKPDEAAKVFWEAMAHRMPQTPRPEGEALKLLQRIRQWDMLDACSDGPYWKREIDALLPQPERP